MTLKEATIASIEIEDRPVDIDVVAPGRMTMLMFVLPNLPDAVTDDDIPDHALTMDEQVDAAYELIDATTDLPRDLIEQLPAPAIEELADAASTVINQQVRLWEREDARNSPFDHTTEVEMTFDPTAED